MLHGSRGGTLRIRVETHQSSVFQISLPYFTSISARLKRDGSRAETRFGLSEKWTSPFKSAGESVQSTTGSRVVRISGQTMFRGTVQE